MRNESAFNDRLTLIKLKSSTGREEPVLVSSATVWARVSDVGVTTKYAALAAGQNVSLSAVMRRAEFADYTHAEYNGVRYKIVSTGAAANTLHIKLMLERG